MGFYQIKDIHQQKKYNSEDKEDVARISFKESLDKKFVDMGMSVRLQPLFNFVSECLNGDKLGFKKNPSGLVGKTIHVESFDLVDSTYNGQTSKVNKVRWSILNYQKPSIRDKIIVDEYLDPEDYEQEFVPEDLIEDDRICPDDFIGYEEVEPEDY